MSLKCREKQLSKPPLPGHHRRTHDDLLDCFACLVSCSMWYEQHTALVSLVCPSLASLVLWASTFPCYCAPGAVAPAQRSRVWSWAAPYCCQLIASHPPARCSVFTCGSKSRWKVDLFPAWRFLQHKIICGWHKGSVAEYTGALLGALLLAGPGHTETGVGREGHGCEPVVLCVQADGIAPWRALQMKQLGQIVSPSGCCGFWHDVIFLYQNQTQPFLCEKLAYTGLSSAWRLLASVISLIYPFYLLVWGTHHVVQGIFI